MSEVQAPQRQPHHLDEHDKRYRADLKSAFERMDLIHQEFERRKRSGLPSPTLDEIDVMLGRSPKASAKAA